MTSLYAAFINSMNFVSKEKILSTLDTHMDFLY